MDITWLGHSCFRLHDADMVVVTDPYPASVGLRIDNRPASVVTVSNTHPHHNHTVRVSYKTEGLNVEIDPIDNFVRRMGIDEIQPQPRLVVTPASIGTDMRVVVMTSQARPR